MKRSVAGGLLLLGIVLLAPPAGAQATSPARRPRAALLRDVEATFNRQLIREMALTPEQLPRFQRIVNTWAQERAALEAEEVRLRQALAGELRPGVAANPDSVSKFVDALNDNRVDYADGFRDEMKELATVLTPVQRGQFQVARDRLLQRVKDLQQQRPGGPAAPGASSGTP